MGGAASPKYPRLIFMTKINITKARSILKQCPAVIVEDQLGTLCVNRIEENKEFLHITWGDGTLTYEAAFNEADNHEIEIKDSSMFLIDEGGAKVEIIILLPANLSSIFFD